MKTIACTIALVVKRNLLKQTYAPSVNLHMATTKRKRKKKTLKAKKGSKRKNRLGVKNSLVNNINARKKKGISRSEKRKTVTKKSYKKLKNNWKKR